MSIPANQCDPGFGSRLHSPCVAHITGVLWRTARGAGLLRIQRVGGRICLCVVVNTGNPPARRARCLISLQEDSARAHPVPSSPSQFSEVLRL